MRNVELALIAAVVVLAGALLTLRVWWLSGKEGMNEELRALRLAAYPAIWKRTSILSAWPRTNATYADLAELHLALRRWYYEFGGLHLSPFARARYGDLQELISVYVDAAPADQAEPIDDDAYDALEKAAGALRTALTEDLESGRQYSLAWHVRRSLRHRWFEQAAERRLARVGVPIERHRVRYSLTRNDRRLSRPDPMPIAIVGPAVPADEPVAGRLSGRGAPSRDS